MADKMPTQGRMPEGLSRGATRSAMVPLLRFRFSWLFSRGYDCNGRARLGSQRAAVLLSSSLSGRY